MAFTLSHEFRSYHGHARATGRDHPGRHRRLGVPMATLVLGAIAALAIAGGALDRLSTPRMSGELSQIEFLTGALKHAR
ncbi:hypothetical protein [Celeribacter indicus]|uniref:Uncharacterized protein n=1 Tax=Celeribacter indicus TaxID=1208324 RepID=A0A0B5DV29_9RHOB|nr:hypothetical protein [Celeribacter indicus]AJE47258.1 hypothetical protein P73_2543 [Celeribacter indicus]SDW01815.1 hypothetical protein SAMN05443573_10196 [Celeribacter indicus]